MRVRLAESVTVALPVDHCLGVGQTSRTRPAFAQADLFPPHLGICLLPVF